MLYLAVPLYSMQVFDRILSSGSIDTLVMLTLVIMLSLILLGGLQFGRSLIMLKLGNWVEEKLSLSIFENAIKQTVALNRRSNNQPLRDLQTLKSFIVSSTLLTFFDLPWALIFLIVLFILHPYIGLLALCGGGILITLGIISERTSRPLIQLSNEAFIKSMHQVDHVARNAEAIYAMGFFSSVASFWQKINKQVQKAYEVTALKQSYFNEVGKFFRMMVNLLTIGLGAYLVLKGTFSPGAILASSSLINRSLAPFETAIGSWKVWVNFMQAYERLRQIHINQEPLSVEKYLSPLKGSIELENISYAPGNAVNHIIQGVSFKIDQGDTLIVLGASGAGKSTLIKVILGILEPTFGSVTYDGISIKEWRREFLGKHIGYLPQDAELFSSTIRFNIARMNEEASESDVIKAAQSAGIEQLIRSLPNGYDTEIGEGGIRLSGGQRQRVALAQAMFGMPSLLVLDEPNTYLDSDGEISLIKAIQEAQKRKTTVILVTHQPQLINFANKVLIMGAGGVIFYGSPEEAFSSNLATQMLVQPEEKTNSSKMKSSIYV